MNRNSFFRSKVLPWILYAAGAAITIAVIAFKCITLAETLPPFDSIFLIILGAVLGLVLIIVTNRQKVSRREYLSMKFGTVFCWACCVFVFLTVTQNDWIYTISLPVSAGCIPYVGLYLPRYIRLKADQDAFNRYLKDPDAKLPPSDTSSTGK